MSKTSRIISSLLLVALVVAGGLALFYRQRIFDQFRVWQFEPSQEIANIADKSSMSSEGQFYFYAAHPKIESSKNFNQHCPRIEKASPIVGCYASGSNRLYIYDVKDPELDGIKEVTAAHEMLHVVYDRLSQSEKDKLGELLEKAYKKLEDPKLKERMDYYHRAQPGSRQNELHSILGTEFSDLGDELEAHYRKYFSNRQAVVDLYNKYHKQFVEIEQRAEELSAGLAARKAEIDRSIKNYEAEVADYNRQVQSFNQRAKDGDFESQIEFKNQRQYLVNRSFQLSKNRESIQSKINAYNQDVEKLNSLGKHINQLNRSLDSTKGVK